MAPKMFACQHTGRLVPSASAVRDGVDTCDLRCNIGQRAVDEFTKSLAAVNQNAPLEPDADDETRWRYIINQRANVRNAVSWKLGMKTLSKGAKTTSNRGNDYHVLRNRTIELLTSDREDQHSWFKLAAIILSLVSFLYQVGSQLYSVLNPDQLHAKHQNSRIDMFGVVIKIHFSPFRALLIGFIVKEVVPITWIVTYLLLGVVSLVVIILVAPFAALYLVMGDPMRKRNLKIFVRTTLRPLIKGQLMTYAQLSTNISSTYRAVKLARQLMKRQFNDSIIDQNTKLTQVANTCFNLLAVVVIPADDAGSQRLTLLALLFGLVSLLRQMSLENTTQEMLYDALKDLNEHRLSKFEMGLLLVKMNEVFLKQKPSYNFIEHLATGLNGEEEESMTFEPVIPEHAGRSDDVDRFAPPLPKELAAQYGHDGLGFYADEQLAGQLGFQELRESMIKTPKPAHRHGGDDSDRPRPPPGPPPAGLFESSDGGYGSMT